MQLSLDQVQNMLGIACEGMQEGIEITSVCRDTRDVRAGALFVCIRGERLDGHDFAEQAVQNGAAALLVERYLEQINVPQLIVPASMGSTVEALGVLAKAWRKKFAENGGKVVAITGSAGKTTVKEVLADLLQDAGKKVARNILNYNNQIGMPLSVLASTGHEDFWVMELGISQPHDMDVLGEILEPDVALVLNVGAAHTEGLGDKGVAYYKSRLLAHLAPNAQAFVCADYEDLKREAKATFPAVQFFSTQDDFTSLITAYYVGLVSQDNESGKYGVRLKMDASGGGQRFEIQAPFYGDYGAENVAAVVSMAKALNISIPEIQKGFMAVSLPKQRFDVKKIGAWTIIDDSYNANPLSMQRMIGAAQEMAKNSASKACYAVLGAMGELGTSAAHEHKQLGKFLATCGVSHIFWKGDFAEEVQKGLKIKRFTGYFTVVTDKDDFANKWHEMMLKPGTVLCKGSRSNALEELIPCMLHYAENTHNIARGGDVL